MKREDFSPKLWLYRRVHWRLVTIHLMLVAILRRAAFALLETISQLSTLLGRLAIAVQDRS